ncbi:MAG: hypothetical protein ACKPKO_12675, partial [Candidatus Fonsibacter sp.]
LLNVNQISRIKYQDKHEYEIRIYNVKHKIEENKTYYCDILFQKDNRCGMTLYTGSISRAEEIPELIK